MFHYDSTTGSMIQTYSVASPIKEWMKSALPNVPVTRGGAGPLGVSIMTMYVVSELILLCVACDILTVFTNMTKDIFVTHLSQSNLAPVTVGEEILKSMKTSTQKTVRLPKVCSFLPLGASAVLNTPF